MEMRISVFTPAPSDVKEFKYILKDVKRQQKILKELTEYVCSVNEAVLHFAAFSDDYKCLFTHNFSIKSTKDVSLINKLLKTANIYVITAASAMLLDEIAKGNNEYRFYSVTSNDKDGFVYTDTDGIYLKED